MILSDKDILKRVKDKSLKIEPFDRKMLQPSTIDFHLESKISVFDNWQTGMIDLAKKQDVSRVIDIGKKGSFIIHISRLPIKLYAGMRIGQLAFIMMSSPVMTPYGSKKLGSKYQNQKGPTASKIWQDFRK